MTITYAINKAITSEQFIEVLTQSTLGERRPVDDIDSIADMLKHTNLLVTAWDDNKLVGVARSFTDYSYCCYMSDLAVIASVQHQGIGKGLIEATKVELKVGCKLVLLSAPAAQQYYPHIGFSAHTSAWVQQKQLTTLTTSK